MIVIFNKKFYKTVDKAVIIWYNIIVRGVFYNKKEHMFAATRGECSTNKTHKNPNDNPKKILINQIKITPHPSYLQNSFKNPKKSYYRNKHRKLLYK